MKTIKLLILSIAIVSCEPKPQPKPIDPVDLSFKLGKGVRKLKDAYTKGFNDSTKIDTLHE
jgi:hypothetical protein